MQLKVFHDALTLSHHHISAQIVKTPKKRRHSSKDSSKVRTGKFSLFPPEGKLPSASDRGQAGWWLGASEHLREVGFSVHVGSEKEFSPA